MHQISGVSSGFLFPVTKIKTEFLDKMKQVIFNQELKELRNLNQNIYGTKREM